MNKGGTLLLLPLLALGGCAGSPGTRPMQESYLPKLQGSHIYSSVPQDKLGAQYNTMTATATGPGYGCVACEVVGLLVADSIINAGPSSQAERRLQPLLDALGGYDPRPLFADKVHAAADSVTWLQNAAFDSSTQQMSDLRIQAGKTDQSFMVVETRYTMAPDFRALIVITHVSLYNHPLATAKGDQHYEWLADPIYDNYLIYQSELVTVPDKTPADVAALTAEGEQKYSMDVINQETAEANKEGMTDKGIKLRQDVADKLRERKAALDDAATSKWTDSQKDEKLASIWTADGCALLKRDLTEGADEIGKLLQMDLVPHSDAAVKGAPVPTLEVGSRGRFYLGSGGFGGNAVSMIVGDKLDLATNSNVNTYIAAPTQGR